MSNQKYSDGGKSDLGCLVLIALFALPSILSALFAALIPYLAVAAVGFGLYQLHLYNQRTGNIERYFEQKMEIRQPQNTLPLPEEQKALPPPQEEVLKELEVLKNKQKQLEQQNKRNIEKAIQHHTDQIAHNKKKEVLDNIFGDSPQNYDRSAEFEKQNFEEKTKKRAEELDLREIKHDLNEQLFNQEKKLFDVELTAKEDRLNIRHEMKDGFANVDARFMHIEGEFANYKAYVTEKFSHLELHFLREIGTVKEAINSVHSQMNSGFAEIKLSFGKEILRIDRQQIAIVDKLQTYQHQVKDFGMQMMKLKVDCDRQNMRAEDMLSKANNIYHRHQSDMKVASNQLNMGLQRMAVHDQKTANSIASAKLKLEEISNDQYFALKDMAHERIGINMLRQDYDQRQALEQEKAQRLLSETRHIEQRIKEQLSRGKETASLQHQLHVTQEQLSYTSHRASLMSQEANMVRRLSR